MKLKYRLVVSFLIIVIFPCILLALIAFNYRNDNGQIADYVMRAARLDESQKAFIDIAISIAIILFFTAAILIIWIYKGIISKINRLIYGAQNIIDGNLNFTIQTSGTDELSLLINTFEDMKERLRKDAEEKLIAESEQRELISNIAHDIKTPLTAIRGYAEGILDNVADTEEKKLAYVTTISKKAEDLNFLLNELMTYSNISTNKIPYNFDHINVKSYFDELYKELSLGFETKNGIMTYNNEVDSRIEMIADPEQLRRVIENIIDNSVKYKGENKLRVELSVKEAEGYIQVEITDHGIGIKNKDLPYIFERTYRSDASRQSGVGGSGLGLSIARKIIDDHSGRIWATSSPGVGTTLYILLRQYSLRVE